MISKDSRLLTLRNGDKLESQQGCYVISGELVSDQIKRNYLQGVTRYDQFSYVPPKEKLICMRESLILEFQQRPSIPTTTDI